MARQRLILSFIGDQDLNSLVPKQQSPTAGAAQKEGNKSPILRLLEALSNGALDRLGAEISTRQSRLVLFDDDRQGDTCRRQQFCARLEQALPELGLADLRLERYPVVLPNPNDLESLFTQVWKAIPTFGPKRADEVVFHLSSGTMAMQITLLLAARSLRLKRARLFTTSREEGVHEVHPPYELALRAARASERATRPLATLPASAKQWLLEDSVIEDPVVEDAYAALHRAAQKRKRCPRVLVRGPTGSGKWHACRQFADWRMKAHGGDTVIWTEPDRRTNEIPENAVLLIRWLDRWPDAARAELTTLAEERGDITIAASYRSDAAGSPADDNESAPLRAAACIELPALGARTDVVALAEALARQLGILDGKLKERLQHDLLDHPCPGNLHQLETLLASADVHSKTPHPDRKAYLAARESLTTEATTSEACAILKGMDFGPQRHSLKNVLAVIEQAVVRRALALGLTQQKTGELLGMSQQSVSDILKASVDAGPWQTLGEERNAGA